ncbi:sugar ABC transporter ATP-binding protein [Rhodococcus sp. 06-462-5]|nr:sugar ABC transporter ATP-binding protein [Rhodococcus sp. 06-462-5]OZE67994.1 sugar ABC transporter ATP-binding protein [Rhodococcus sp. 02-925g]OZF51985.1 sugar ABC transporter ATP-binding protein [Rhodococcus sp. 14-1411-2a]
MGQPVTTPRNPATIPPAHETAGEPLVVVRNAVKRFGATTALDDLSITIRQGESHGLVGRNGAGKSTLVATLTGLHALDSGTLEFSGEPAPALTDRKAWLSRVSCVYQHRTLVPELSVAENIYLNTYNDRRWVNWKTVNRNAQQQLDEWEIPLSPHQRVAELGVGEAQMIEIVRALAQGSRFVILDEPTAQLVAGEIDSLMSRVNQLRDRGVTFMFISHHLDEVPQVCDSVTVLRNGHDVLHGSAKELSTDDMVTAMVGNDSARKVATHTGASRAPNTTSPVVLEVADLEISGLHDTFSLTLHAGEVVGLAGHAGSGSRQIAHAISGHLPKWKGSITLDGHAVRKWDSHTAVRTGVTLVPEDRIKTGLVGEMSIEDNITFTTLPMLSTRGMLSTRRRHRAADTARDELGIACSSVAQPVGQLSGGNQQKVLLGAALGPQPKVLVLMHPTAGVDIASKGTIMDIVEQYRARGLAVIVVSDEPEELAFCDRVQVWVRGRKALEDSNIPDDQLVAAMEGSTMSAGAL